MQRAKAETTKLRALKSGTKNSGALALPRSKGNEGEDQKL
jgi:hypothetical protein